MKPTWKKYLLYAGLVVALGGLAFILIETVRAKNTGFETKTLRDWMELLIIPFVLAGGALFLNRSERELERKQAEDRAKLERDLATDRQQEAALQAYIDRMAELLLEKKMLTTKDETIRNVAKIRTLTVLRGLDANRKGSIIKFLYEAKLITGKEPVLDLEDGDLGGANLGRANLRMVYLKGVHLEDANLEGANLEEANLEGAHMIGAFLPGANLEGANLSGGYLGVADLEGANLNRAILPEPIYSD